MMCDDVLLFQEKLAEMRRVDDNIILLMNKIDVGKEDECERLWEELHKGYTERKQMIDRCQSAASQDLEAVRGGSRPGEEARRHERQLRKRAMAFNSEAEIETIVENRSLSLFRRKCRNHVAAQRYEELSRGSGAAVVNKVRPATERHEMKNR